MNVARAGTSSGREVDLVRTPIHPLVATVQHARMTPGMNRCAGNSEDFLTLSG